MSRDAPEAAARLPAVAGAGVAAASLAAIAVAWALGGGTVDLPWAPELGLRLHFELDGLGALYALLATGVGLGVFVYSAAYMPRHLAGSARPAADSWRFNALLALFMASMVGLATAQDMVLLFVCWDLTAIASYLLIAYDRDESAARSALMALLVTGVTAVLLLIAALVLRGEYGTFQIPLLLERAEAGATLTVAGGLVVVAALAKSAQVPFHFWLPRAMVAPTPVSAYLHSAAMVAAGVLLIGRLHPLIASSELLLGVFLVVGVTSIAVGGVLALTRDDVKQLLAYSTVSQYGYVVFLYGLGGEKAAVAAALYVLAHALAKSTLFMTAGALSEATGSGALSQLGGLARRMPAHALASGVAVLSIAGLPLTVGFFADELLFGAAAEHGTAAAVVAVGAAGLTLAYLGRFWIGAFLGAGGGAVGRVPVAMTAPALALAGTALVGGLWYAPFAGLAESAATSTLGEPASASVGYHLDLRTENVMALGAYALGALALALRRAWAPLARAASRAGDVAGPARVYGLTLAGLDRLSDWSHDIELRDLRTRVAAVLVPGGALVAAGLIAVPVDSYAVGRLDSGDAVLGIGLALTVAVAIAATLVRHHLTLALTLAAVGFGLAVVYATSGAPDVALVAVVVETVFTVLFLAVFSLLPGDVLRREERVSESPGRHWRDPLVAVIAGSVAFVAVWSMLSQTAAQETVATAQLRLTDEAHAGDAVTAILSDFRALDTLVEVSVVAVALLGVLGLLRRERLT